MPCAILQKSLEPPEPEQLVRAFQALSSLTDSDAVSLAKQQRFERMSLELEFGALFYRVQSPPSVTLGGH